MEIRQAKAQDYDIIYDFVKEAFSTAEVADGTEQDFVVKLRAGDGFIPELEFVAEEAGEIVGHIMFTKRDVVQRDGVYNTLLVAPLSVSRPNRSQGIGAALMQHGFDEAVKLGYQAAFLVGNPEYYERFGFRESSVFGIKNITAIPDKFVLGCEIVEGALSSVQGTIDIE